MTLLSNSYAAFEISRALRGKISINLALSFFFLTIIFEKETSKSRNTRWNAEVGTDCCLLIGDFTQPGGESLQIFIDERSRCRPTASDEARAAS
jgi:hypothetical protein